MIVSSPEFSLPPYQPVIGNAVSSRLNSESIPSKSESSDNHGSPITSFMFENDASLCTMNLPPCPFTILTASNAFTNPAPCVSGSLRKSLADDMSRFRIVNGS